MRAAVTNRNIQTLYHFTKFENIDSIMKNGIVPRNILDKQGDEYKFNDCIRLDAQEGSSSFSVEHPNYKLFYRLRKESEAKKQEWVVIGVQRNVLWDKDCAFCHDNAANASVTAIPIEQRKTLMAFENMFKPFTGKPSRADLKLSDAFPTNPQAEVLVFNTVEPKYILSLICENDKLKNELEIKYPNVHVIKYEHYFMPRFDHKAWK